MTENKELRELEKDLKWACGFAKRRGDDDIFMPQKTSAFKVKKALAQAREEGEAKMLDRAYTAISKTSERELEQSGAIHCLIFQQLDKLKK